jgi:hypothetical protein
MTTSDLLSSDLLNRLLVESVGPRQVFAGGELNHSTLAGCRRSCFNLIHFETSFKVDIFISRGRPFDQICMDRAVASKLGGDTGVIIVPMATVEDSIISKLEWYRLTDETSERQWDDVSRLVRLTGTALDTDHLAASAQMVGVSDLLLRLLDQASR